MLSIEERAAHRVRCYGCFRPAGSCYCRAIPTIANRTAVLILQHVRERFHPFNTARIVHRALTNSQLSIIEGDRSRTFDLPLRPNAALLYPTPGARLISDVPSSQRPDQLVILDGTWHHAKTLVRDIPALGDLPRLRLDPQEPSRYRVRREPTAGCLSTVEATVAALRAWEPDTPGLDAMLSAFDGMVERQLAHPQAKLAWRRHMRRQRTFKNIPVSLTGNLDRVVVVSGESAPAGEIGGATDRLPVYWVAERLGTGERFACAIQPPSPVSDALLSHWELARGALAGALSLGEARTAWAAFLRPADMLAVYTPSTARLLARMHGHAVPCLVLKSIDFNPQQRYGTLDALLPAEQIVAAPPWQAGRAGKRLAAAVALVRHLNALGQAAASGSEP